MSYSDDLKSQHSKGAIGFFVVASIIIFWFSDVPILHLGTLGYLLVGIFFMAIVSIPAYYLKMKVSKKIVNEKTSFTKGRIFYVIFENAYYLLITMGFVALYFNLMGF